MNLVLITGKDCGECMRIKRNGIYNRLIHEGENNTLIDKVIEISQESRYDDIPREYPTFIQTRLKMWVPLMFLISSEDFKSENNTDTFIDNIKVFGGKIEYNNRLGKRIATQDRSFRYNYETFANWINDSSREISRPVQQTRPIRSTQPIRRPINSRSDRSDRSSRSSRPINSRSDRNDRSRRSDRSRNNHHVCRSKNRVVTKY